MKTTPSGLLLVNKPRGMTSHDVVDLVRFVTGVRRIGHAGTLDPLAGGLLIVLVGREATKKQADIMAGEKEYKAAIRLGSTSATDDAEGEIFPVVTDRTTIPDRDEVERVLQQFIGEIEQTPPVHSAVKIGGIRSYKLARGGKPTKPEPRKVTIRKIELLEYAYPLLRIRVACAKGTYIHSLARDIGKALSTGAYLDALTRTRSGEFRLEDALDLEKLNEGNWREYLVKLDEAL